MKKKVILVSILVIVILVSALLVGYQYLGKSQYTIEPSSKYNKIQLKGAKLFIETDYLTEKEMQQIAKMIEEGIEDLDDYFGDKHNAFDLENQKISYFIKSGPFVSGARGSTVQLSYVKENRSPYIHETVHIMAGGYKGTKWLEEGQAVYINKLFTKNKEIGVHSQNLHQRAKLIIQDDALKEVLSFDNAYANYHLKGEFELRHAFYYVSGSLVQYIAETYGKEAMFTIYQTEEVSEVIDLSFEELKQEWISYLETLEKKDVNK